MHTVATVTLLHWRVFQTVSNIWGDVFFSTVLMFIHWKLLYFIFEAMYMYQICSKSSIFFVHFCLPVTRHFSDLWIKGNFHTTGSVYLYVCVCVFVCHTWLSAEKSPTGAVYCRRKKQLEDEEICVMASDDWSCTADSTTAITDRYWDWWERKLALEKWITHTKFVVGNPEWKIQRRRYRRG